MNNDSLILVYTNLTATIFITLISIVILTVGIFLKDYSGVYFYFLAMFSFGIQIILLYKVLKTLLVLYKEAQSGSTKDYFEWRKEK